MQAFKFVRNVVATCAALLAIIVPVAKATAQAQSTAEVRTVLLIHGAWADGSSWSKVIPMLEAKGLHVVAVQIPLTSFADDVSATQRAIALEDGPVLLVGHSYGGAVITEAGNDSKVAGLVYVSAVAPDKGESAFGLITSVPTPIGSELRPDKSGFLKLTPKGIAEDFAQDLSAKEIAVLIETVVVHHRRKRPGNLTRSRSSSSKENRSYNHHCPLQPRHHARSAVQGRRCDFRCGLKGRFEVEPRNSFLPKGMSGRGLQGG
jgi:pimeloyl-ACP methyl ester carboxylesterase